MVDDPQPVPPVERSVVVRRATLGARHVLASDDPRPRAVVRQPAYALIVQHPTSRSTRAGFMLEFFGEEGRWSRGHRFDSLQHALDAAAALAAIEPEDWRAVDEPFGTAPPISADLLSQLMSVPASIDGRFEHRPTQVRLRDGVWRDGVYLEELQTYIDLWGLPPGHDRRQCEVEFTDIVEVRESSRRLPVHIANALYEAGESAMGGCCFTLVTNSGLRIPCRTGNFVDFIDLPTGVTSADIARVEPHAVDARTAREAADTPDIMWSVYKLAD